METISFALGVVGVIIGIPAVFGMTVTLRRRYNWRAVMLGVRDVATQIEEEEQKKTHPWAPNMIIGLADGAVPAAMLALNLRIQRLYFVDAPTSSRTDEVLANLFLDNLPPKFNNEYDKLLIVDNHIFSGNNMRAAVSAMVARGACRENIRTCAILRNDYPSAAFTPDFTAKEFRGGKTAIPWSFSDGHKSAYVATTHG